MNGKQPRSGRKAAHRRDQRREAIENDPRWADHIARRAEEDAEYETEAERSEVFSRLAAGTADDVDQWCARFDRGCFYHEHGQ